VANVAQDLPVVEILTLVASIFPPCVECNPLADPVAVEFISVSVIVTFPFFVATTAFAPFAAVVIFPPVIVSSPPFTKSITT
jgi:hypothetical protein